MAWVSAEYAEELAVVFAWISLLLPWSLTVHLTAPAGSHMIMVRFPIVELQIRLPLEVTANGAVIARADNVLAQVYPGTHVLGRVFVTDPLTAASFYGRPVLQVGSLAWALGGLCVLVAVGLSVWLYRDEVAVRDRLPLDVVRTIGALLGLAALSFAVAAVGYAAERTLVGVPLPIGTLVVGGFAIVLLRIERG